MPAEWKYNLTINDYNTGVITVRQMAKKVAQHCNFAQNDAFGLELVLDEAITNAWEASSSPVEIVFRLSANLLTIQVLDRGMGLALGAKCSLDALEVGGRGCYLMQAYMDEVLWENREGGGMCCTLKKRVSIQHSCLKTLTDLEF